MKCFFHSADFDGKASGAIVKFFNPECDLFPAYYGMKFPWHKIKRNEVVYMVDFGLQPFDQMVRLANSCQKLIWIDHHISAIRDHDELWKVTGFHIAGLRNTEYAACELTWQYFNTKPIPEPIKLLGRYDVWDLSYDPKVLPFQYGLRALNPMAEDNVWHSLGLIVTDMSMVDKLVNDGISILRYIGSDYNKYMKRCGFQIEFEGYKAFCVNRGFTGSHIFEGHYNPEIHDIMISFCYTNDYNWRVSLYTEKDEIDCSKIAKKYGGGGHPKASGFQCDKLPFKLKPSNLVILS